MSNAERLLHLKEQIEQDKTRRAELNGQLTRVDKTLKEQWQCSTPARAQRRVDKLRSEVDKLNTQLAEGIAELEEKYGDE